jgi:hypothetical protein
MLSNKFMMQKHLKIFFLILFGTFFLANNSLAYGNHQPLEIIAPKEAGTGNPAIPSTHRVFRAYPGIQYEFKAQVIGGTYPYVFSLSNAPEGMTIDRKTGVIIWPNPQQDANDIQITVHDKNGTSISSTWDIDVTTNGFIFVDANAQDGGNGTLNSPYNKINDFSSRNATDIVCFREGTYNLPVRGDYTVGNASGYVWSSPTDAPHKWIAYPGEDVTIDLTNNRLFYGAPSDASFYFEGLRFYRGREYFFRSSSSANYATFYNCVFDTLTLERTNYNSNQGAYFTMHSGVGYYLVFQNCRFTGFRGPQAIGSIYDNVKILVENCTVDDFVRPEDSATNQVMAFKVCIRNLTFRRNEIILPENSSYGIMGGSTNSLLGFDSVHGNVDSQDIEISYNHFRNYADSEMIRLNSADETKRTWFYRNTISTGKLVMRGLEYPDDCDGPWYFENNVFQNSDRGISYHYSSSPDAYQCIGTHSNNLGESSGLVNSGGFLINRDLVGTYGWEIAESEYWNDGEADVTSPSSPTGLSVS